MHLALATTTCVPTTSSIRIEDDIDEFEKDTAAVLVLQQLWWGRRATAAAATVVDMGAELVDLDDFQFEFHEEVVYCDHSNSQCCGDYNGPYGHNQCLWLTRRLMHNGVN
jgi:hypothetical protein